MGLFRDRELTVRMHKVKDEAEPIVKNPLFNVDVDLDELKRLGKKTVIAGVAIVYGFVLMDTFRQVQVEKAKHPKYR